MSTNEATHMFYSARADEISGHVVYQMEDGTTMKGTALYRSVEEGEANYKWPDKVYVGKVARMVSMNEKVLDKIRERR